MQQDPVATCIVCGGDVDPVPIVRSCDRLYNPEQRFDVHECRECGLGITSPRPAGEELAVFYPDSYSSWQVRVGPLAWYATAKGYVLARLPPYGRSRRRGNGRMLDVGLGRGDLAWAFAQSGWEVHGLDNSAAAVGASRARGIDARIGTLDDPPWAPETFDLIVLSHVLEHVDDPVAALQAVRSLLRPGGKAIVAVPGWDSWQRRMFQARWSHTEVPRHLQHFTVPALNHAAGAAGFTRGRVRRGTSMVGLPISIQFAVCGRWPFGPWWRNVYLMGALILYPLTWLTGRIFGGDCTYLELRTTSAAV